MSEHSECPVGECVEGDATPGRVQQESEVVEATDAWAPAEELRVGGFRLFTEAAPAPPWCVTFDDGSSVVGMEVFCTAVLAGKHDPLADNKESPRYWLEGVGRVTVCEGVIYIDSL